MRKEYPALTPGQTPPLAPTAKDGVSQWEALLEPSLGQPREELVYNIKEKPFMAALRLGDYKIIWGSRTQKDTWFPAQEEPVNRAECDKLLRNRASRNRNRNILIPRDNRTMDIWDFDVSEDLEYEEDYDNLEKLQAIDLESDDVDEMTELEEDVQPFSLLGIRLGKEAKGGNKKKGNDKKKKKKKRQKFLKIPNKNQVEIKSWGDIMLFNLLEDPEERRDLAASEPEMVEKLKARAVQHFYHLFPRHVPDEDQAGHPQHWGGYFGPGWCQVYSVPDQN